MKTPMTARPKAEQRPTAALHTARAARRWLLFVHQLPSGPSNLRVRTWRRLQQLGAIPIKQAVYALPDTPDAREDFEWLKSEVKAAGGDASVFAADNVDAWSDDGLIEEFRRSRQEAYAVLARDIEKVLKRATGSRRPSGTRAPAIRRLLEVFRNRLTGIEHIDFFGSAGRNRVATLFARLEGHTSGRDVDATATKSTGPTDAERYQGRLWITRPRPGVDRMASAWLIRRFIDPQARFGFAAVRDAAPEDGLPFDMFGVEFSHQGEGCTFETLCGFFKIQEPAVARIAAIVHDLDLKDSRFGAPEAATVGHVIDGLQFAHADDDTLLSQGMSLFDSLYRSFEHSARVAGPRALAKPRRLSRSKPTSRSKRRRAP
jgi:hypothetical protein